MVRLNITRLAVAQVTCVFYCLLAAALSRKICLMARKPPVAIAEWLRDYGLFLLVIPVGWFVWALAVRHLSRSDFETHSNTLISGLVLTVGLFTFALILSFSGFAGPLISAPAN